MFRIFGLLFICLLSFLSGFQLNAQENTHVNVLVFFNQHPDWVSLRNRFSAEHTPVNQRPAEIISALRQSANATQPGFREFLSGLSADANLIRSYHVVNACLVSMPAELINNLYLYEGTEYVILQNQLNVYPISPVDKREANNRAVGSREPGADAIAAPFMWNLGYTGLGRKLFTVDTGVWPVHPAISRQWLGNHLPVNQVWVGFDSEQPADKTDAHGTHVTGTVLGLDPLTNDTIGVAFNAKYMASDPIVENPEDIKPVTTILEAFEFALNPDGNELTSEDVPDVICNSWGIGDSIASGLCTAPFIVDLFSALDMAGIAVEYSAGNEGPGAGTISLPQYVTLDSLNIFTVGALDANVTNLPIASFSSRGPTSCDVPDAWKIKPEVSAPGVDVRSCVQWDGYALYSGTSMAGPHVAGAVLLLKEAFPYLTGREILNALYQSAIDLGEPGEDNVYGRGIINLEAAFNFLSANNTPVPPQTSNFDIQISGFNLGEVVCEGNHEVIVVLENTGSETINAAGQITLRVDGVEAGTANSSGVLQPGQTINVPVVNYLFTAGDHEVQADILLASNVLEREIINNSRVIQTRVQPRVDLPYGESFEFNDLSGNNLLLVNPDYSNTWDTINTAGLNYGRHSARMRFITYGRKKQFDKIYLPAMNIPPAADSVMLRFNYAYRFRNASLSDSLFVEYSDDCGDTWNGVFVKGGQELATVDTNWTVFKPFAPEHWGEFKTDLKPLINGNNLLLRFSAYNAGGSLLYLDNIGIYTQNDPTSLAQTQAQLPVNMYPNPAVDLLNLESPVLLNNVTISVSDLSGRLLSLNQFKEASTKYQIDTSQLPAGLYIVQLRSNEGVYSARLLK